jgi:hypothetical protein
VTPIDLSIMLGLVCLGASLLGAALGAVIEHWLATEPREPVARARWRVGPRRLLERTRRELAERGRGGGKRGHG